MPSQVPDQQVGLCVKGNRDGGDELTSRFWTYLVAALQIVHVDLGQDTLHLLQATHPPSAQGTLNPLLNDIAALAQAPPTADIVLVLDDYHLISTPHIHEGIAFLLEHQPHNLHLVISPRADPPVLLFRLRARGQLSELRSDDLRFAPDEATTFLKTVMDLFVIPLDDQRFWYRCGPGDSAPPGRHLRGGGVVVLL